VNERIKKVVSTFKKNNIDAFLVFKDINIRYLTNFPSEESLLFICPGKAFYITDSRYAAEARKALKGIEVACYKKSLLKTLLSLVSSSKVKRMGINENHINVSRYKAIKAVFKEKVKIVGINNLIEDFRAIKDESEISLIKKSICIHRQVHNSLKRTIKPGITERDVYSKLHQLVMAKGAAVSFSPIIASGKNSCFPHAKITDRKILENDIVLVDMGIDYKGYKSDLTRMFFLGRIPQLIRETTRLVCEAQQRAIGKIKADIPVCRVDKAARNYLSKYKLSKYFSHALGHGIGLDVHETPIISKNNKGLFKEGMIVTIEPAVYFSNRFGVRLEEMVLVTNKGCEVLSDNIN